MVCNACGRNPSNESANYCEYCGTSFRDNIVTIHEENKTYVAQQDDRKDKNEGVEKPISFGNWMGTMLLPLIPIVGPLIYIVMLFVWSFSSDSPKSKKNWARATLIISVLAIILFVFMFTSTMMELLNSGMNLEEYMGQINY
jgi:uncharacterized membrane protein YvbJ